MLSVCPVGRVTRHIGDMVVKMKKGSMKKKKEYLSIMLVPHSSQNVKVLKFSRFYPKLVFVIAFILLLFALSGLFIAYTLYENENLKKGIAELRQENVRQSGLISEKADEIDQLKQREESINDKIKDFMDKYREMADTYLSDRSGSSNTSRGGSRTDRSFMSDIGTLKTLLDNLDKSNISDNEVLSGLADTESKLEKYMRTVPSIWPASGRISSYFGGRPDPFSGRKKSHEGIDIAASYGQNIKASADGVVTYSGYYSGYGYTIVIDHGHELSTLYGHCSKLLAKKGQQVKQGEAVAKVGSSGRSTGSHLHFEVRVNGEQVDPLKYLEK